MRIDCTQCEMYRSEHCDDCLVSAILHPPAGPVDIDGDLDPSLAELAGAGLIPVLKFKPRQTTPGARVPERPDQAAGSAETG